MKFLTSKKFLFKLIVCVCLCLTVFQFGMLNVVQATGGGIGNTGTGFDETEEESPNPNNGKENAGGAADSGLTNPDGDGNKYTPPEGGESTPPPSMPGDTNYPGNGINNQQNR